MGEEVHSQPDLQTTDSSISGSLPAVAVRLSLGCVANGTLIVT